VAGLFEPWQESQLRSHQIISWQGDSMYHFPSNAKKFKPEVYVKRHGVFEKLPPKKQKRIKIAWQPIVFAGLIIAGWFVGSWIWPLLLQ
jgi:hypothetical protein